MLLAFHMPETYLDLLFRHAGRTIVLSHQIPCTLSFYPMGLPARDRANIYFSSLSPPLAEYSNLVPLFGRSAISQQHAP